MPTITIYGTNGGTNRTTTAALALGFVQTGKIVTVIGATNDEPWLTFWASQAQKGRIPSRRLTAMVMNNPSELANFLSDAAGDLDQIFIIDTAKHVSAARCIALELANLVVVPSRHFLDAAALVSDAIRGAVNKSATHPDISQNLTELALEVQKRLDDGLCDRSDAISPRVLHTFSATLRDIA